mgnify:CR=1 FL=1
MKMKLEKRGTMDVTEPLNVRDAVRLCMGSEDNEGSYRSLTTQVQACEAG